MIDWRLLFSPRFWFAIGWNPLQPRTGFIMAAVFGLFLVAGATLWFFASRRDRFDPPLRRALKRFGHVFFTVGLLGLFFTLTAYEQAGVFAARFWFLLLLLIFAVWLGSEAWRAHILIPAEREAASIKERLKKYFGKKRQ